MTLGPSLMALAWLDRPATSWRAPLAVIGRVPMFFFVVHFWALHVVASALAWVRYGGQSAAFLFHPLPSMGGARDLFPPDFGYSLRTTYIVWILVVVALYPLCRWFASLKERHRGAWWVGYV